MGRSSIEHRRANMFGAPMGVEPPRSDASSPRVGEADQDTRRRLIEAAVHADLPKPAPTDLKANFKPLVVPSEAKSGRQRQIDNYVEGAVRGGDPNVVGTISMGGGPASPLTAKPITRAEFDR